MTQSDPVSSCLLLIGQGMNPHDLQWDSSSFIDHTQPEALSKDDRVESGEAAELVQCSPCGHEHLSSTPRSTFFKKLGMAM